MLSIKADGLDHRELNEALRSAERSCRIESCCGQRFIAAGMADKDIIIQGVPGNALGAYLNGSTITVQGNAQDAVGDTMNAGTIVIHGNVGDAAGYAMRGGRIFVKGDAGYRAGIQDVSIVADHMMLAAWNIGVGSCWVGRFDPKNAVRIFGLPDNIVPVALLPIGYSDKDALPSPRHESFRELTETVAFI